ncbi:unnamed protein product [Rotaria magnacalcarata]|uniref:CBM1 domain-containing protein n=2 Tax=Rotaria magnacalcarata TaxID=392030 RepID=A0A816NCJ5_9BILA|nr:unnamed protein product [Rotaria magnacalcarata]
MIVVVVIPFVGITHGDFIICCSGVELCNGDITIELSLPIVVIDNGKGHIQSTGPQIFIIIAIHIPFVDEQVINYHELSDRLGQLNEINKWINGSKMYQIALLMLVFVPFTSSLVIYDQCGGEGYGGSTYCNWPLQCFQRSRWYSSCQMSCPGGDWECARTGGSNGRGALAWEQCGGDGWNGPQWCTEYPCRARSIWYSQCRPDCPDGWLCTGKPTSIAPVISTIGSTSSMPIITGSRTSSIPIITGSITSTPSTTETTFTMPTITLEP